MRRALVIALGMLLGCGPASVAAPTTGTLLGELSTVGADAGIGFIYLYPGDNPPAPAGSGRPVQVTGVPEPRLFGGEPPNADFTLSGVPAGTYLARGMIDTRHLFDPFVDVMAQPFAEDFDAPLLSVSVVAGKQGWAQLAEGHLLTWDPPSFIMDTEPSGVLFQLGSDEQVLSIIHLTATPFSFSEPSAVAFQFDIPDGGGLATFPEVVVQRIPEATDGPEFDDAEGNPLQIVLAATAQPDPAGRNDVIDGQQVVNGMYVAIAPIAEVVLPSANPAVTTTRQLPAIPIGTYQITVLEGDGRYWQVPNGLAPGQPFASQFGGPYPSQGPRFEVILTP